jgi:hypothetical protein
MKEKIVICMLIILGSCSDTIDFVPTSSFNEVAVWENEASVKLYVNSFYRIFEDYFQYGNRPVGNDATLPDGLTDIMKYTSNSPGEGTANLIMTQDGYTSVAANHFDVWGSAYAWNRRILEFLQDLDKYSSRFTPEVKNRIEAEVRFFRGYMFFLVMRNQGPFIIRTSLSDPVTMPLNTENECWDFIAQELDFAAQHLPSSWNISTDEGRVTKWAALAFKSRAMLYAKRWPDVIEAAEKVIRDGGFALETDFADVFKNTKTKRSPEHILVKKYNSNLGIFHNLDERIAPSGDIQGRGGVFVPTQELVDAFLMSDGSDFNPSAPVDSTMYQNRESRFYATILYNGATWKGRKIETWVGNSLQQGYGRDRFIEYNSTPYPFSTVTGYYIRKMADEENLDFNIAYRKSDQDCVEIRLAEVYLNLAEAYLESNRPADAQDAILAVRNRSLQKDASTLAYPLRDELIRERMLELAFEGHRFWDLRRWGLAESVLHGKKWHGVKIVKQSDGSLIYTKVPVDVNTRIYPKKFDRFPLPVSELNNNPLIPKQPDGW